MSNTSSELSGLLMAYADGRADAQQVERTRAAIGANPLLVDELMIYATTGPAALAPVFGGMLDEPVPERFSQLLANPSAPPATSRPAATVIRLATSRSEPQVNRKWRDRHLAWVGGAIAAAAVIFVAGVFVSPVWAPSPRLVPDAAVSEALNSVPSGKERQVATIAGLVSFKGIETFRDRSGALCREFEAQGLSGARQYGVACRGADGWTLRTRVLGSWRPGQQKITAGEDLANAVDQIVTQYRPGDPLSASAEAELIAKGWPTSK